MLTHVRSLALCGLLATIIAACERPPTAPERPIATPAQEATVNDETPAAPIIEPPREAPDDDRPPGAPRERAAIDEEHYLFIGRPLDVTPLDCDTFDSPNAPHNRPPQELHDATDFPQRHHVSIEVVEVLRGPSTDSYESRRAWRLRSGHTDDPREPARASLAIALGIDAFPYQKKHTYLNTYDKTYCKSVNALLASPYVVIHAYGVYVDHGNSIPEPFQMEWEEIGTELSRNNAGFQTIEEARSYAEALLDGAGGEAPAP